MPNYRRNFVVGGCYFFTVNLLERRRTLLVEHIDLLRESVRRVKRLSGCRRCENWQVNEEYGNDITGSILFEMKLSAAGFATPLQ